MPDGPLGTSGFPASSALRSLLWEAGELVLGMRRVGLSVSEKPDGTLVTDADRAASTLLCAGLRRSFPDDVVVSEEDPSLPGEGRVWFVDPIDGTSSFAGGGDDFCVLVGLVSSGPVLGVAYYPARGEWYWGARGRGAFSFVDGRVHRLRVRPPRGEPEVLVNPKVPYDLGAVGGSGTMRHLRLIVRGELDGYVNERVLHWDLCVAQVLVEEAGGVVVGYDGEPLCLGSSLRSPSVVAGHPRVVERVVDRVQVAASSGR